MYAFYCIKQPYENVSLLLKLLANKVIDLNFWSETFGGRNFIKVLESVRKQNGCNVWDASAETAPMLSTAILIKLSRQKYQILTLVY